MRSMKPFLLSWPFQAMRWVLFIATPLIALYVGNTHMFPYTTPKALWIVLTAAFIGILWGIELFFSKSSRSMKFGLLHIVLILFMGSLVLSAAIGLEPRLAFFGTLVDGLGVIHWISLSIIAVTIASLIRRDGSFLTALLSWFFVTGVMVAIGTYFVATFPTTSGGSTIGNTSYAGAYLLIQLFIGGYLWWVTKGTKRFFVGVGFVTIMLSPVFINLAVLLHGNFHNPLLLAGSANGAIMGIIGGALVSASFLLIVSQKSWKKIVGGIILGAVLIGSIAIGTNLANPSSHLYQVYVQDKNTNRFVFWDIARIGYIEQPILGWGMNSYSYIFQKYFTPEFFSKQYAYEPWTDHPHNTFWEIVVSGGVIGIVLYLALYIVAIFVLYKKASSQTAINKERVLGGLLIGALVGYFLQNLFVFDTPVPLFAFFLVIGITLAYSDIVFGTKSIPNIIAKVVGVILIVSCCLLVVVGFIQPWRESVAWVRYANAKQIMKSQHSPQAISFMGYIGDEAYFSGKIFDSIKSGATTATADIKKTQIPVVQRLVEDMDEDIAFDKNIFRGLWVSGQLRSLQVFLSGMPDGFLIKDSRAQLLKALAFNRGNANLYFDIAQTYLFENNYKGAWTYIRAGIAISPEYPVGYRLADKIIMFASKNDRFYIDSMRARWGM